MKGVAYEGRGSRFRDIGRTETVTLAAYFRAKGWRQAADLAGKGSRMAEVLRTLADGERRSRLEVLQDIQMTTADLLGIRAPNRENGTLLPCHYHARTAGHCHAS